MTTNLIATLSIALATNTVEHWPQKQVQDTTQDAIGGMDNLMMGKAHHIDLIYPMVSIDDTNADTKSIETTVTGRRLLSFEFEQCRSFKVLTNWTEDHYEVDYRRVRTNVWIRLGDFGDEIKWPTHPDSLRVVSSTNREQSGVFANEQTNWWEPTVVILIPPDNKNVSLTNGDIIFDTHEPKMLYGNHGVEKSGEVPRRKRAKDRKQLK